MIFREKPFIVKTSIRAVEMVADIMDRQYKKNTNVRLNLKEVAGLIRSVSDRWSNDLSMGRF